MERATGIEPNDKLSNDLGRGFVPGRQSGDGVRAGIQSDYRLLKATL